MDAGVNLGGRTVTVREKEPRWNLFLANHLSTDGVGDWSRVLSQILSSMDIALRLTSTLDPQANTIILDDFSERASVEQFESLVTERRGRGKLVLAMSEFPSLSTSGHLRLNHFEGLKDGIGIGRTWLRHPMRETKSGASRHLYMRRRAKGLERILRSNSFDAMIVGHPAQRVSMQEILSKWGQPLPPILDVHHPSAMTPVWKAGTQSDFGVTQEAAYLADDTTGPGGLPTWRFRFPVIFQGFGTPFRDRQRKKLARQLRRTYGADPSLFRMLGSGQFHGQYWGIDPVIPRSSRWPYLSPFRILRSHTMGLIPVAAEGWASSDNSVWRQTVLTLDSPKDLGDLVNALILGDESIAKSIGHLRDCLSLNVAGPVVQWRDLVHVPTSRADH